MTSGRLHPIWRALDCGHMGEGYVGIYGGSIWGGHMRVDEGLVVVRRLSGKGYIRDDNTSLQ